MADALNIESNDPLNVNSPQNTPGNFLGWLVNTANRKMKRPDLVEQRLKGGYSESRIDPHVDQRVCECAGCSGRAPKTLFYDCMSAKAVLPHHAPCFSSIWNFNSTYDNAGTKINQKMSRRPAETDAVFCVCCTRKNLLPKRSRIISPKRNLSRPLRQTALPPSGFTCQYGNSSTTLREW